MGKAHAQARALGRPCREPHWSADPMNMLRLCVGPVVCRTLWRGLGFSDRLF